MRQFPDPSELCRQFYAQQPNARSCHPSVAEDPEKTSNIWHLVSINLSLKKWYEKSDLEKEEIEAITDQLKEYSPDLELLERRMKQFLGLHYKEPFIESGIERLAFDNIRYTKNSCKNSMKRP